MTIHHRMALGFARFLAGLTSVLLAGAASVAVTSKPDGSSSRCRPQRRR